MAPSGGRRDNSRFMIAGIQMPVPISGRNIAAMTIQVEKTMALYPGTDMIVFSELAMHGPLHACASADPQADEDVFQALAAKHRVWIIPGSAFVERDGKLYNEAVVINPEGEIVGRYDKMFPFMPVEAGVAGGSEFLIFDVPDIGRFGQHNGPACAVGGAGRGRGSVGDAVWGHALAAQTVGHP